MLKPKDIGQMVPLIVPTPDGEGDILRAIPEERSSQAPRRLELLLLSFPFS